MDGVQATRLIKDEFPEVAVLVLTENLNDSYVIDAIHAGVVGYIFLKDMSPQVLLQSIHRVVEGGIQMKTELLRAAVNEFECYLCPKSQGAEKSVGFWWSRGINR
jgi:DNA-binding NarL/FixJ family response regulator